MVCAWLKPDSTSSWQDYHWQWRSFLTSGFTAVYFLVYAIHYFFSKLQITGLASTFLYFGYTMIMALIFFLFTGVYSQTFNGPSRPRPAAKLNLFITPNNLIWY